MYLGIQIFLVNTEKLWKDREHLFFFSPKHWGSSSGDLGHFPSKASPPPLSDQQPQSGSIWKCVPVRNGLAEAHLMHGFGHYEGLRKRVWDWEETQNGCALELAWGQSCVALRCPGIHGLCIRPWKSKAGCWAEMCILLVRLLCFTLSC